MPQLNIAPRGFIAGVIDRISRAAYSARRPALRRGVGEHNQKVAGHNQKTAGHNQKAGAGFPVAPWFALDTVSGATWLPRDYTAFAREGFMQNAIVYRCVRMIAEAAASVPLCVYDGPHELEDHPLLRLLARPTPTNTRAEFMESLIGFLLVSGNTYVEAIAAGGQLRELHVLRPDRITLVPGDDGWPEAYDYAVQGMTPVRLGGEVVPGVRKVTHQKLFHPLDDHYGLSPIEAAAVAIDIHNAASRWNKALLDNSARPSGALVYTSRDGNLTSEQYDRLKRELEAGFQGSANAGRPLLLEGGLDWKTMSMTPKDLDFMEAKHGAAREIALALGVPPMLLGIPGDNTFSNYQEANRTFWRQTVLPLVQRTTAALSEWLTPAYGETLSLQIDLDDIPALASEQDALYNRLNAATFLTTDEKRAAAGYGPGSSDTKDFNPDQPRDDQGQWTRVGGGGDVVVADGSTPSDTVPRSPNEDIGNKPAARDDTAPPVSDPSPRIPNLSFKPFLNPDPPFTNPHDIAITWHLDSPSPNGGYFIQEVRVEDENGKEILHYWEAWEVLKGTDHAYNPNGSSGDDTFSWVKKPGEPDRVTAYANARYYDGIDNTDLYKMGFRKNSVPSAGVDMFGTTVEPKLPTNNASPRLVREPWRNW